MTENEILSSLQTNGLQKELEGFFNSKSYNELVRQLSVNNIKFKELPEKLKLTALYLNHKGLDSYLGDTHTLLYKRKPPTIEEYLTVEHGGPFVEKLYPGWKNVTLRDFASFQKPLEVIASGCIGSGKTSYTRFLLIWTLIRISLLRNPQATLNVTQETVLVLALFTLTLDKAALALIKPFVSMMETSPYFVQVEKQQEFKDYTGSSLIPYVVRQKYVEMPNNIIINLGSQVSHALSFSTFAALLDEAEWGSNSVDEVFSLYTNLKERVRSRFLGSQYTLMCLVSSARYSRGIIADYVNNTDPNDPLTKVYSFAIWDIKHFEQYKDKGYFYVLVGNKSNPHRILTQEEQIQYENNNFVIPTKCQVIKVPEVYRKDFASSRIDEALNNLAGIAVTSDSSFLFSDDPVESDKIPSEVTINSNLGDNKDLFQQIPETAFNNSPLGKRFNISPNAVRYMHLDLAESGVASLAVLHKEIDNNDKNIYILDLLINVITDTKIDINAISNLIIDISKVCHLRKFTSDQYQSAQIRQKAILEKVADEVELLSVVKTTEPYETFSRIVMNKQLYTGKCPELKKQLSKIQMLDTGKIKQGTDGSFHGDSSDACCGALISCILDLNASNFEIPRLSSWYYETEESKKQKIMSELSGYELV